jgi:hypothetical protein
MRRRTACLMAVGVAIAGMVAGYASPAYAAGPSSIDLSGPGLPRPLTIRPADDVRQFRQLLSEVDWLATRPPNAPNPDQAKLGPKYQLTVLVDGKPSQTYDLYPLAVGGPRVWRPAEQPGRKGTAAWLYGRVSMPETLRSVGVPLVLPGPAAPGNPIDSGVGGQGGGTGPVDIGGVASPTPATSFGDVLDKWSNGVLLVGGGSLVLLVLIGCAALLVRKGPRAERRA